MKKTRTQLKATAYHEAGHAVIGRVLTLSCGRATIKPDRAEAGHASPTTPIAAFTSGRSAARCAKKEMPFGTHGS